MRRYVFQNTIEWITTNKRGNGSEELVAGLKVFTKSGGDGAPVFFQRPFFAELNDRYLFLQQHPTAPNNQMIIPLNQIVHTVDQLKLILTGQLTEAGDALALAQTNQSNITTNANGIATNAGNITSNDQDITSLTISLAQHIQQGGINYGTGEEAVGAYDNIDNVTLYRQRWTFTDTSGNFNTGFKKPNDTISVIEAGVAVVSEDLNGMLNFRQFDSNDQDRVFWDGDPSTAQLVVDVSDIEAVGYTNKTVILTLYYIKSDNILLD